MRSSIFAATLLGLLLALTPFGCNDEVPRGPSGVAAGDEVCKSSCQECEDRSSDAYACMAFDEFEEPLAGFDCIVCDDRGSGTAAARCEAQANRQALPHATMEVQVLACDSMAAKCTGWHPNREVREKRENEWDVDRDFIAALVADPSQLAGCDDTRVMPAAGFYRVTSVDSDDLLGRLGFIDDDMILSINGHSMNGLFPAVQAFFQLWPDTRVFTVSVFRPGIGTLTLTYNLV